MLQLLSPLGVVDLPAESTPYRDCENRRVGLTSLSPRSPYIERQNCAVELRYCASCPTTVVGKIHDAMIEDREISGVANGTLVAIRTTRVNLVTFQRQVVF